MRSSLFDGETAEIRFPFEPSLKRTIFVTSIFQIKWNIILFFDKLCIEK